MCNGKSRLLLVMGIGTNVYDIKLMRALILYMWKLIEIEEVKLWNAIF